MVAAYAMLQFRRIAADALSYSLMNGAGAALILISLMFKFNLGAFLMEAVWLAVSLYGVYRYFASKK